VNKFKPTTPREQDFAPLEGNEIDQPNETKKWKKGKTKKERVAVHRFLIRGSDTDNPISPGIVRKNTTGGGGRTHQTRLGENERSESRLLIQGKGKGKNPKLPGGEKYLFSSFGHRQQTSKSVEHDQKEFGIERGKKKDSGSSTNTAKGVAGRSGNHGRG